MPATVDELAQIYLDEGGHMAGPPLRPKDAATLIVVRRDRDGPRVLMGERHQRHAFQPGKLVFPGGRLDAGDQRLAVPHDLAPAVMARVAAGTGEARARGLALAAVRETFEETGVILGERAAAPRTRSPSWRRFFSHGVVPNLTAIDFVGRAVTPPGRNRRYDTRFFMADASAIAHTLDAEHRSDELLDPVWLTLPEARAAKIMGITRLMLDEVQARLEAGRDPARPAPFYAMVRGKPRISYL
jgi:8-oxo-dGTP pyrophosphatase MutT (NUDIX family)